MSKQMQKLLGLLAMMAALMSEGALIVASAIGFVTTAEDVAELPQWFAWLITTPWWVPGLVIPALLIAFAAWVFSPDLSIEKRLDEVLEKITGIENKMSQDIAALEARLSQNVALASKAADSVLGRIEHLDNKVDEGNKLIAKLNVEVKDKLYAELPREITAAIQSDPTWSGLWAEQNERVQDVESRLTKLEGEPSNPGP